MKTKIILIANIISGFIGGMVWGYIIQSSEAVEITNWECEQQYNKCKINLSRSKWEARNVWTNKTTKRNWAWTAWTSEKNSTNKTRKNIKEFNLESTRFVKENFIKNDEVRIRYIAWVLYNEWYCKIKKNCLNIWLVANAIIRAEGWNKTTYWTSIYHNPFHIKYCHKKWYEMWLVIKQDRFCVFKDYRSSIIAWWRMWESQGYNSNSIKTAIRYTWNDNAKHWLRIVNFYKNKFNYLIK